MMSYVVLWKGPSMARKVVKVYLTRERGEVLSRIAERLGMSESECLRLCFLDYAKQISMIESTVHTVKPVSVHGK